MAADTITARFEKIFDATDKDNDGVVGWSDYEDMADRVGKAFEQPDLTEGSDRFHEIRVGNLKSSFMSFWLELEPYGKGSKKLSKEQFVTALSELASSDKISAFPKLAKRMCAFAIERDPIRTDMDQDLFVCLAKAIADAPESDVWAAFSQAGRHVPSGVGIDRAIRTFLTKPEPKMDPDPEVEPVLREAWEWEIGIGGMFFGVL
ncbi:hypothetical protein ACIQK6_23790 [Streptomyces sp. NPDC091682]|uniref:hypothetical protein n=1 Tax=Streptomyces sp. NPDC091682 TaxID=3366005 RepID=UPI0037F5C3B3